MSQPGLLTLADLEISAVVGIYPQEREAPQRLLLHAEIETDFSAVRAEQGRIVAGFDYHRFAQFLEELITRAQYGLLEDLTMDVANAALREFPGIVALTLAVRKPAALPQTRYVEARLRVTR